MIDHSQCQPYCGHIEQLERLVAQREEQIRVADAQLQDLKLARKDALLELRLIESQRRNA